MKYVVDNAIIFAAGYSSRLIPIAYEKPKAMIKIKGEILIERQIKQLKEAGIHNIIIVTGYKKEAFNYLIDKFGVQLIENNSYPVSENHTSLYVVKDYLRNSYICSSDLYFVDNPFTKENQEAYYASVYVEDKNKEWCIKTDENDYIEEIKLGGRNSWVLKGHAFFTKRVSRRMSKIIVRDYHKIFTYRKPWEEFYKENTKILHMKSKRYEASKIYKIDTMEALKELDPSYCDDLDCKSMEELCLQLNCEVKEIIKMQAVKDENRNLCGMKFIYKRRRYFYDLNRKALHKI
ncbi:MAG: NTP transferase domain-containing protein [Erysipelotrichaceae bacterium]